jgi:5-methylcytosine-specific restriction endonuclease McrA
MSGEIRYPAINPEQDLFLGMLPEPRKRNSAVGKGKIQEEGVCRVCRRNRLFLHRHHVVPKSMGGGDVSENIIPICSPCHREYHNDLDGNLWGAIRAKVRDLLQPEELAYVRQRFGPYPSILGLRPGDNPI